jgi:phage tail sheath protein FI
MAETLLSPGVFLNENDASQITQGPIAAGAALIGPTVVGPVNIPTVVTSYSQFKALFGTSFISGGLNYEYLTSIAALNYFEQGGQSLIVTRVASGSYTPANSVVPAINGNTSFTLETLSVGTIMNNTSSLGFSGSLASGSTANVRWEITGVSSGSGVFNLAIRRGDDYDNSKTVLETWNNLSLDPNQNNYIGYVIGDQTQTVTLDSTGDYFLQTTGSYQNKSNYVRVSSVSQPTPGYFDQTGQPRNIYTGSLPQVGTGASAGAFANAQGPLFGGFGIQALDMFESIASVPATQANNIQGLVATNYDVAINLLENQDAYNFNAIYAPGLNSQNAASQVNALITLVQTRGDAIAVVDMVGYGSQINTVTSLASGYDNSYAATYWPWLQIRSRETGKINFVPASTLIPAVYEYNDKVSAEWFAPAGMNRGSLSTVLQPERRLTVNDRNILYQGKVNPIATFPGVGTVIYGQKTLQQKPSALDRVNVRRLLIALKQYIGQLGEQIVFEPNTQTTRNKFVNQVNPYLESVQQRQGLYAFQVVMDESNNTPDVIDRNQLVGTIYLQPTKTAEFIQLDFNILPTGASFSQ